MKVIDYVEYISKTIPKDALIVASHTDNTEACIATGLSDRGLVQFNMGFATPVGLGVAIALPHRKVITLDGDGGVLLLPSAMGDVAARGPPNMVIIVADNESSLGFTSHSGRKSDIEAMAKGAGFKNTATVRDLESFKREFSAALKRKEPSYIVCKTVKARSPFPPGRFRPHPWENKFNFVRHIEKTEKTSILPNSIPMTVPEKKEK